MSKDSRRVRLKDARDTLELARFAIITVHLHSPLITSHLGRVRKLQDRGCVVKTIESTSPLNLRMNKKYIDDAHLGATLLSCSGALSLRASM